MALVWEDLAATGGLEVEWEDMGAVGGYNLVIPCRKYGIGW